MAGINYNPFAAPPVSGMVSNLFDDPGEELRRRLAESQKQLFSSTQAGSAGKVSTMMGYANAAAGSGAMGTSVRGGGFGA